MKGTNPYYQPRTSGADSNRIRFSSIEVQHLGLAVAMLTVGVALVLADRVAAAPIGMAERLQIFFTTPLNLVASFLAVASGFVLHELAHKFVAIKYGCLAEFRAQPSGLAFGVFLAALTGFIFAAPGAVQIYGHVDHKENGLISLAGPGTNIVIASLCVPFVFFTGGAVQDVLFIVAVVNAGLAVFNLLPFGPLDGKKIFAWNRVAWGAALLVSLLLVFAAIVADGA